jgi:hypothetical protein
MPALSLAFSEVCNLPFKTKWLLKWFYNVAIVSISDTYDFFWCKFLHHCFCRGASDSFSFPLLGMAFANSGLVPPCRVQFSMFQVRFLPKRGVVHYCAPFR